MNETQRKALLLLGLARKARKLEIGEEPCGIACRSGKAKLLLIAHDAGDHTFRRARSYCRAGKPPYLCVPFTKDELGDALGCNACALCAILDAPFAKAFLEDLPELAQQHEEILQELTRQTARVQKRRQEERQSVSSLRTLPKRRGATRFTPASTRRSRSIWCSRPLSRCTRSRSAR